MSDAQNFATFRVVLTNSQAVSITQWLYWEKTFLLTR